MLEMGPGARRFTPIYYRIQEAIRDRIVSGASRPGDRLPSETELARDFNTTRVTVRHALSRLVYDGLIVRQPGRGTFVAEPSAVVAQIDTLKCHSFEQQVALSGKAVSYQPLSYRPVPAPMRVASRLSLRPKDRVYRLDRLRKIDDRIVGLEIRHIPVAIGRDVTAAMLEQHSVYDFMCELTGDQIPTIEVSLTATCAGKRAASQLRVRTGSALLVRDHVYRNTRGEIILCGISSFPGDIRIDYVLGRTATALSGD